MLRICKLHICRVSGLSLAPNTLCRFALLLPRQGHDLIALESLRYGSPYASSPFLFFVTMGYASLLFVPLALVITVALADTTESSWASETTSVSGSSGGDTTPSDAGDSRWTFYYIGGAM